MGLKQDLKQTHKSFFWSHLLCAKFAILWCLCVCVEGGGGRRVFYYIINVGYISQKQQLRKMNKKYNNSQFNWWPLKYQETVGSGSPSTVQFITVDLFSLAVCCMGVSRNDIGSVENRNENPIKLNLIKKKRSSQYWKEYLFAWITCPHSWYFFYI